MVSSTYALPCDTEKTMGSGEGTGEAGAAVGLNMLEAAEDGEGCSETPQEERGNARVQCLDTKFRLQLMKTQVRPSVSRVSYSNESNVITSHRS